MDKAGGYGIQDGDLVASYKGSYSNVVGLPLERVRALLKEGNYVETCDYNPRNCCSCRASVMYQGCSPARWTLP
ncbi:MAG: Maf family protein [Bacteroidaceae bacterium]